VIGPNKVEHSVAQLRAADQVLKLFSNAILITNQRYFNDNKFTNYLYILRIVKNISDANKTAK